MRVGRLLGRTLAGGASVLLVAAVGAPLSLRYAPVRRAVVERINGVLAKAFVGHVVVDAVEGVGLTSISGIAGHVDGADGVTLARVSGTRARVSTWSLVLSLMARSGPIEVDVPELSVADASALVDTAPDGKVRLAEAFAPRRRPRREERAAARRCLSEAFRSRTAGSTCTSSRDRRSTSRSRMRGPPCARRAAPSRSTSSARGSTRTGCWATCTRSGRQRVASRTRPRTSGSRGTGPWAPSRKTRT